MPSSHLPVVKTEALPQVSVDSCLLKVLAWNPNWLNEYGMSCFMHLCFVYICWIMFRLGKFLWSE